MNVNFFCTASVAAALLTGSLLHIAPARAAEVPGAYMVPSRTVHYGDLNLQTTGGVEVLYRRINEAAEEVCSEQVPDTLDLQRRAQWHECVESAVARSVAMVGDEHLAALYTRQHSRGVG